MICNNNHSNEREDQGEDKCRKSLYAIKYSIELFQNAWIPRFFYFLSSLVFWSYP